MLEQCEFITKKWDRNLVFLIQVRLKYDINFYYVVLSICTRLYFLITHLILAISPLPLVGNKPSFSRELIWEWELQFSVHKWKYFQGESLYLHSEHSQTTGIWQKKKAGDICHQHIPCWNLLASLFCYLLFSLPSFTNGSLFLCLSGSFKHLNFCCLFAAASFATLRLDSYWVWIFICCVSILALLLFHALHSSICVLC